jgi:hypothetical protein
MAKLVSAASVLTAVFLTGSGARADEAPLLSKLDQPLYVVTQARPAETESAPGHSDVIAVEITPGKGKEPAPGTKVPLFTHGKRAGEIVVRKKVTVDCEGAGLAVTLPKGFGFSVSGFGLATAARNFHGRDNGLRKANTNEEKEFLALARKRFADKKDFGTWDPKGKTELLGAMYTRAGKNLEYLIGTVKSTGDKELDTVFMVARVKGKELVPELVLPGISADLEDGQDLDFITYAEQADLDADGVDEIIAETRGYETKIFTVWKRLKSGKWESVGTGGESGC